MNKQKILLGVLLVGLILALFYAFWASPVPEQGRLRENTSGLQRGAEKDRASKGDLEKYQVRLDLLERGVDAFREPKRDLFQLSSAKPPVAPPKPATAKRPLPAPVVPRPPTPPPVVAPPAARLSVLGYLQTEKDSKVFLSSGRSLYVVEKGARFGPNQEFFVEDFTLDEVVVRQADRPAPIHLPVKRPDAEPPSAGFSPPAASPFRIQPGAMPSRPVVPDAFMNDIDDEIPSEDDELDTDEAGDEGSPEKEGVHE